MVMKDVDAEILGTTPRNRTCSKQKSRDRIKIEREGRIHDDWDHRMKNVQNTSESWLMLSLELENALVFS